MADRIAGPEIERLIALMAKLPGLGRRSARKAALHLIKRRDDMLLPLANAMREAAEKLTECSECGNVDTASPCTICSDPRRDRSLIVVVEEIGDLWALERAGAVRGLYHVLGGHLVECAVDGDVAHTPRACARRVEDDLGHGALRADLAPARVERSPQQPDRIALGLDGAPVERAEPAVVAGRRSGDSTAGEDP
jgi:hypothetical protein